MFPQDAIYTRTFSTPYVTEGALKLQKPEHKLSKTQNTPQYAYFHQKQEKKMRSKRLQHSIRFTPGSCKFRGERTKL